MTKALPFIVKPPEPEQPFAEVGNPRVGVLRIPLLGWLTGEEAGLIGSIDPENRQYIETCVAAVELSKATEMDPADAYQAITNIVASLCGVGQPLSSEEQTIKIIHWQIVVPLARLASEIINEQTDRRITAMVRRLEGCADWTDADSRQLPPPLKVGLAEVAWREEMAMAPKLSPEDAAKQLAEDLGKLLPEPLPHPDPTGESSTGNSESSTPAIPTAAESGSGGSRRRTSSKRSNGATSAAAKRSMPQS